MYCFYCGDEIGDGKVCPSCGNRQDVYLQILYASNVAYNEGLRRASVRDLSGAAAALNQSLKYNKYNTVARNLLGLVYFEVGETVLALREWVISKNLQPDGNGADAYIEEMRKTGYLKKLDQTTRKFNQALSYCMQGSRDLARIQLRRVLQAQPKMIKAHQLLALVCMQDGRYEEARKSLSAASKIDYRNPITMEYQKEVRSTLKGKGRKKRYNQEAIDYSESVESANLRSNAVFNMLDSTGSGIINVVVGIILGVLACIFLVMPSMREDMNLEAASALVTANEEAANSKNNVSTLEKQVEDLSSELEKYNGMSDVKTSYEQLLATEDAVSAGDMETAKQSSEKVSRELLDAAGQARYDVVIAAIGVQVTADNYEEAQTAMAEKDYAKAIELLTKVVAAESTYEGGDALYNLADCCEKGKSFEDALKFYQMFIDNYPGTRRAKQAERRIDAIVAETGLDRPVSSEGEANGEAGTADGDEGAAGATEGTSGNASGTAGNAADAAGNAAGTAGNAAGTTGNNATGTAGNAADAADMSGNAVDVGGEVLVETQNP